SYCRASSRNFPCFLLRGSAAMSRTRSAQGRGLPALEALEARDLPSFVPPVSYPVGDLDPFSMVVKDLNGDGRRDVAVTLYQSNKVAVLLGDGTGALGTPMKFATSQYPHSVSVADFNGDGKPDLVTGNIGTATVSVFLGNGDGTFQPKTDFSTVKGAFQVV